MESTSDPVAAVSRIVSDAAATALGDEVGDIDPQVRRSPPEGEPSGGDESYGSVRLIYPFHLTEPAATGPVQRDSP